MGFRRPGLTLPLTDLRDKMRPLEVVRSRRGARVDESTCLESMRLGNGTVGSNPTLSAIYRSLIADTSRLLMSEEGLVSSGPGPVQ